MKRHLNRVFFVILCVFCLILSSCNENIPVSGDDSKIYYTSLPSSSDSLPESDAVNDNTFTVAVTGDICFADNWEIMKNAKSQGLSPTDCISPQLLDKMQSADICLVNNEFCYSDRGEALEDKAYTFRAAKENVKYLHEWGVDIAGLANNHIYDYGEDAFLDTLEVLNDADIPYIGAGKNKTEAYSPYYTEVKGIKLAFVSASRAEKYYMTPVTSGNSPGIAGTYDWETESFINEIREADKNADVVIVYVHWGTEYSEKLQESQKRLAKKYIDAGADAIVGAHAHILQGFEFYNGVPIIYNLGNFWFNNKDIDTVLLELEFNGTDISVHLVPAKQKDGKTVILEDTDEGMKILQHLESISENVTIDENGYVLPA